ncbi:MAG: bifunctional folylpolyglutamate synthase/dihydrofolate synthase [Clostridiales bacterium]|nr:bifunctional folylpolyglutamate synthase/dihydrofolate synthase [Clostridiales bacterium]MBS5877901.1 bifunctional folylpolyglutamate synthase/dihydrofolate synthase [Clostridiales bacterium]MDU0938702.1 folylpolyglutamate synthase/dihydrofolate synthase family protein [Clostridiales bacterium]MDU1041659.1 folylpolyglutamate synthase/dihydrofolate synthase family protein [Clostridiales bacterium]MDU3490618.1 folylpolyglutamate synthase/dihydrofolate synthase family protein [Clostridiales bac
MTYKEVLSYLDNLPAYDPEKVAMGKTVFNQDAVNALAEGFDHPQNDVECIHIAGTNGKGSTAAFITSALLESGLKVGTYTSPFLIDIREEICINGEPIPEEAFADVVSRVIIRSSEVNKKGIYPTAFEIVTASAFLYFKEEKCDIAVIETGLGGRTDATNIIKGPLVNVITNIGLDHVGILGGSLMKIAEEKAGIIQEGSDTVIIDQDEEVIKVFKKIAKERSGCLSIVHPDEAGIKLDDDGISFTTDFRGEKIKLKLGMKGVYQVKNASLAAGVLSYLADKGYNISKDDLIDGFLKVRRPVRFEILRTSPVFIADGSHNEDGVRALVESLEKNYPGRKVRFILGVLADKDFRKMFELIRPLAEKIYTITPDNIRAMRAEYLYEILTEAGFMAEVCADVETAIRRSSAESGEDDIICAFGSLSYMGEVRKALMA